MSETADDLIDLVLEEVQPQLGHPQTEELCFNRPGEAWWLRTGCAWERLAVPGMTYRRLRGLATLAAAQGRTSVGPREPILSCDLPQGHRLQMLIEPAVEPGNVAAVFRRPSDFVAPLADLRGRYDVSRWNQWTGRRANRIAQSSELLNAFDAADIETFLRLCATNRRTVLFCGPTGAGKTFLLKTYLGLMSKEARVLVLEDAREAVIPQPNHLRMIFGPLVRLPVLLKSAMRMRPDFVVLQEVRDPEAAWLYVNEGVTGHPGSPATIHGRNPQEAFKRLFNLIKASPEGASIEDSTLIDMLSSAIDVVVPVGNEGGIRSLGEVWFTDDVARRGESLANLLREA